MQFLRLDYKNLYHFKNQLLNILYFFIQHFQIVKFTLMFPFEKTTLLVENILILLVIKIIKLYSFQHLKVTFNLLLLNQEIMKHFLQSYILNCFLLEREKSPTRSTWIADLNKNSTTVVGIALEQQLLLFKATIRVDLVRYWFV